MNSHPGSAPVAQPFSMPGSNSLSRPVLRSVSLCLPLFDPCANQWAQTIHQKHPLRSVPVNNPIQHSHNAIVPCKVTLFLNSHLFLFLFPLLYRSPIPPRPPSFTPAIFITQNSCLPPCCPYPLRKYPFISLFSCLYNRIWHQVRVSTIEAVESMLSLWVTVSALVRWQ